MGAAGHHESGENRRNIVCVYVDGPNFSAGAAQNFYADLGKLKDLLEERYGEVGRFLWYDFEEEAASTPRLDTLSARAEEEGRELMEVIDDIDDPEYRRRVMDELMILYGHKKWIEARRGFLRAAERFAGAEIVRVPREEYKYTGGCPYCYRGIEFEGRVEGKAVDFRVAIDMIYGAGTGLFDTAVLISGDGHFVQPVIYVQEIGKRIVVASFEQSASRELQDAADEFLNLNLLRNEIELRR